MPGDLKIEKKKQQTNKQTDRQFITKTRPLDFVIMGYEILSPAKHALVVQKMESTIHHINHYPVDKY